VTLRLILALVPLLALGACTSSYDPNDPDMVNRPAPYSSAAICYHKQGPTVTCSDDQRFEGVLPRNAQKECAARYEPVGSAPLDAVSHLFTTSSPTGQAEATQWLNQQRAALACTAELTLK
jgi:hypothetical protein